MKILVTGGAGFIGSNLVDALVKEGRQIVVIDDFSTGNKKFINSSAKLYDQDILSGKIAEIFGQEKPEVVYHLAARVNVRESIEDPVSDCQANIEGSLNILEQARKVGTKKIIFASSGGAMYGDTPKDKIPTPETYPAVPISPYGINKLAIENYLYYYNKVFGISSVVLRFSNVYGPRQNSKGEGGVVAIFIDKILNNEQPVIYGDGEQTRDMVFIDDVVKANISVLASNKSGVYNISTGIESTVNQIFDNVVKVVGSSVSKKYVKLKTGDQKYSCLDYSLAKKELNWQPETNLEEGIKKTVEWFKKTL